MANGQAEVKSERLESEVREMHLKEEDSDADMDTIPVASVVKKERSPSASAGRTGTSTPASTKRQSRSPVKMQSAADSPAVESEQEDTVGGDVTLKQEPGKPPKLSRTTSHKVEKRAPALFLDWEDKTAEATGTFTLIPECNYANRYLGSTDPALECDCAEEWDAATRSNNACGEDSDCINRATKMECVPGDCGCGTKCQNMRFSRKQFADVTVIKTEKKGYGLRANTNLKPNDFIFEYIGDVIGEQAFRRRMQQYDQEGIKHFYFMSLTKGEFVDATKKGNLGRFCNHSCNPNCYVDKWVVGDKLRMGIFAERKIQAGEELVFNYNVDRYGADPQPCYCGEPNCTGYIGGKTQTERATKLSKATIEALGIDDADAWDTAVAKKPRKKKTGEDDEEYVNNVEPRELDESGVRTVMSQLPQCKEKWIAVKLLNRIQRATDQKVINQVVKLHGYRHLKTALSNFMDDVNICLQILEILDRLPRITRNKIQDARIEDAVQKLVDNDDERVAKQSQALIEAWSKLEVGYRIPRVKRDPNAAPLDRKVDRTDRRDAERRRTRSRSRTKSPERIQAPTGPRSNAPQRAAYQGGPRPPPRFRPPPPSGSLPPGWFEATAPNGSVYYYDQAGTTSWQRPAMPAHPAPPPPPPKALTDKQILDDLIKNIVSTKQETAKQASVAATPTDTPKKDKKEEKWRSWDEDKQRKAYSSALAPHIQHVVNKYKHKLPKDDLKRIAKDVSKKIITNDFKSKRVENPNKVSEKHAKTVKKYAQETFERAVKKKADHDKKKTDRKPQNGESHTPLGSPQATAGSPIMVEGDAALSDDEIDEPGATPLEPGSPSALKRRRDEELLNEAADEAVLKKQRTDPIDAPPPPPPPPPAEALDGDAMDAEDTTVTPNGYRTAHADGDSAFKGAFSGSQPGSRQQSVHPSEPMQTATPPTTGSPYREAAEKAFKKQQFTGMNPERMRQLGLDGATE